MGIDQLWLPEDLFTVLNPRYEPDLRVDEGCVKSSAGLRNVGNPGSPNDWADRENCHAASSPLKIQPVDSRWRRQLSSAKDDHRKPQADSPTTEEPCWRLNRTAVRGVYLNGVSQCEHRVTLMLLGRVEPSSPTSQSTNPPAAPWGRRPQCGRHGSHDAPFQPGGAHCSRPPRRAVSAYAPVGPRTDEKKSASPLLTGAPMACRRSP